MRKWRIEDSTELYNIAGWGLKYFSINERGHVAVTPREGYASVDLKDVMDELQVRDIGAPVLLRFPDILDNRVEKISRCFKQAAADYDYKAQNYIIYPIKVNQIREVVEEIVSHGKKFNIGLEAGSKPELHAVLATNIDENALIICNGYKDENYVELALLAQKMGRRIFLVVEKLNELRIIARIAKRLQITPNIGIRIKLSSSGSGKWEESGGDQSKFGLNSSELLEAVDFLERNRMTGSLKLIHFHIGSQITKIRRIKNALREAVQFYIQLTKMGFNIDFVDIGGGLGVDYDGTRSSSSESSMNYSIQEYANDAISALVDACVKNDLPQPNIITESGRSLSAHHSVLIFEVLESASLPQWNDNEQIPPEDHELARELYSIWDKLDQQNLFESWHDALQIREEALDLFSLGLADLRTRAKIEKLFWSIAREVSEMASSMKHPPEELRKVAKMIPDKYFCNFSLFQSLPDSWAIDQVFPIMPISRLDEKPTRQATIQDMTCDSDGKITHFITSSGMSASLPVHTLKPNEPYYIGGFLVGAYQEIL
ncbi:MAG: biosynthetic arginine decarboxylase, partial [Muribaculaceae bacterium]|nr:biosynthetic arginine decarboxylase [Muribaculaceae bacterium]